MIVADRGQLRTLSQMAYGGGEEDFAPNQQFKRERKKIIQNFGKLHNHAGCWANGVTSTNNHWTKARFLVQKQAAIASLFALHKLENLEFLANSVPIFTFSKVSENISRILLL